jgi:hypothetical protein
MATSPVQQSPGQSLQSYLECCEEYLDWFAHSKITWAELLNLQAQAARRHNGVLADHFLVRAHNREALRLAAPSATATPEPARPCLADRGHP